MRKKLFIATMAILAMASCSKNEVVPNQNPNNLISLKPYVSNSVKAEDANNALIQTAGIGFNVYAWYNTGAASTAITADFRPSFMDSQNVTYNAGAWTYSPAKYWPANGSVDFIAVGNNATYAFTKDASPAIEFTASATPADQKDLVVSAEQFGKTATDAAISFKLKHLLSKIDVQVKNTSELTLEVTAVKFTGIAPTATYDLVAGTWSTPTGTVADNVITIKSGLTFAKDNAVKVHENNEGLIIIPQDATSIVIEYTFKANGVLVDDCTGANAITIDLTGNTAWAKNAYSTYTLAITPKAKEVKFEADVENWDTTTIEK